MNLELPSNKSILNTTQETKSQLTNEMKVEFGDNFDYYAFHSWYLNNYKNLDLQSKKEANIKLKIILAILAQNSGVSLNSLVSDFMDLSSTIFLFREFGIANYHSVDKFISKYADIDLLKKYNVTPTMLSLLQRISQRLEMSNKNL